MKELGRRKNAMLTVTAALAVALWCVGSGSLLAQEEYLPIIYIKPVYPEAALERAMEGYVIVEFTVTEQGAVRGPRAGLAPRRSSLSPSEHRTPRMADAPSARSGFASSPAFQQ